MSNFEPTITDEWLEARCAQDNDCLIWKLAVNHSGHPRYSFYQGGERTSRQVRRVVWERGSCKKLQPGQVVTVTCGNPLCLNRAHMKLTTQRDVIIRMGRDPGAKLRKSMSVKKWQRARGKLTMEKARYIRSSTQTLHVLAAELGVSTTIVSRVRRNQAWVDEAGNPFAGLMASNDSARRAA